MTNIRGPHLRFCMFKASIMIIQKSIAQGISLDASTGVILATDSG